jgi:predicted AlkP superfamily phosphohydrolase/phosphomutase
VPTPLIPARCIAVLVAAIAACGCADAPEPGGGRVLLVGIDGASPLLAMPLIEAGRLPQLAQLAREGAAGPLASLSPPPYFSPRIWNTVSTGKHPRAHRILGFVRREEDGRRRLYRSTDRVGAAIWNIFSSEGRRVAVVNWWTSYPPAVVNGAIVSDYFFADQAEELAEFWKANPAGVGATVSPPELEAPLREVASGGGPLVPFPDPFASGRGFPDTVQIDDLKEVFERDTQIARIALHLEKTLAPDLLVVFLPGIDRVSHHLWGMLRPEDLFADEMRDADRARELSELYRETYAKRSPPPEEQRAHAAEALRSYYEYTDRLIGELLERYGPEDLVLVVSDHGFEWGLKRGVTGLHETERSQNGVIFARGPGIAPGQTAEGVGVADVTPTILAWTGYPQARDMVGRPAPFLRPGAPPPPIDTYDLDIVHLEAVESDVEREIEAELRVLGYIE